MINTKAFSKSLDIFADEIRIKETIYDEIRKRRNTIVDFIKTYIENKDVRLLEQFNIGSYKIKTGVKYHNGTFDIDYALVFDNFYEFNEFDFKENLTNYLRLKIKEHYKLETRIESKKNVIAIKFYDSNKNNIFHLDIALYVSKNNELYQIKKNKNGINELAFSEPKKTYERQNMSLDQKKNPSKRKAIRLLKYLMSRNRFSGVSSIYITDMVISFSDALDTFSLMKKFFEESSRNTYFYLKESPKTNLIEDFRKLNEDSKIMLIKFNGQNNKEVFDKLNSIFNMNLSELDREELKSKTRMHYGG